MSKEEIKKSLISGVLIREEKDKHRALLAGVIFFMVLIALLWAFNIKDVFKSSIVDEEESFNVDKFSQDLQRSLDEFGAKTSELKQINPEFLSVPATSTVATPGIKK
jgi:hypothetical protein